MIQLNLVLSQVLIRILTMNFQQTKGLDFTFFMLLTAVLVSGSNLFLYCFFGSLATSSFEDMIDSLYASEWENLPMDLQQSFIILLANVQRELFYSGFGVPNLNLDTFTNVSDI